MSKLAMRSRRARGIEETSPRSLSAGGDLDRARSGSTGVTPSGPVSAGAPLLVTPYATLSLEGGRSLVRFVRTELPYASLEDIEREGNEVERALAKAGKVRLLVDLRAVTPRDDPRFEVAIATFRRKVFGGGKRAAIVVRTAVGALQVKRHMREDGFAVEVFTEEAEALAFLERGPSEWTPRWEWTPRSAPGRSRLGGAA